MLKWFETTEFSRLEIVQKSKGERRFVCQDPASIAAIARRIAELPVDGDMMKSFAFATLTKLSFESSSSSTPAVVELYDGRFKTPSTGFNAPRPEAEQKIAEDIAQLLNPELGKRTLKMVGSTIAFEGISVIYQGSKTEKNDQPGMPTIGPTTEDRFNIVVGTKLVKALTIHSGQTPPAPQDFEHEGKQYVLETFVSGTGERLYPAYFVIRKK